MSRGFITKWSDEFDRDFKVGDKLKLMSYNFIVEEIGDDYIRLENKNYVSHLTREDDKWIWHHIIVNKNTVATITVV
jgi:hypothetical protein